MKFSSIPVVAYLPSAKIWLIASIFEPPKPPIKVLFGDHNRLYKSNTTVKSLQRFLGMATFSLRFIPNMATMTAPLRHLLRKGSKFEWTPECKNNFIQLKNTLHQAGQLAHPDFSRPFLLQKTHQIMGWELYYNRNQL